MGNIKSFEEFNEEINLKKTLAGVALGAGLALGSPSQASAKEPTQTEISQTNIDDFSEVIHVDSTMKKADIQKIVYNQLSRIPGVRITSNTQDKIACLVTFNSKPENSSGSSYGNMEISFKDGKYKIDFYDIYFDYIGQQPQTVAQQIGQNTKRQMTGLATSVLTSQIRNPILQGTVRQTAGTISGSMNQNQNVEKDNLTYQQSLSENPNFTSSINKEISSIVNTIKSGFGGNNKEEDW